MKSLQKPKWMKNKSLQSRTAAKARYRANKWAKENSQTDEPERASSSGRQAQKKEGCAEESFTPVEDIEDEESIESIKCIEDEESSEAIEWIEKPQDNFECMEDSEPGSLSNIEQSGSAGRIHERLDVVVDSGASANDISLGYRRKGYIPHRKRRHRSRHWKEVHLRRSDYRRHRGPELCGNGSPHASCIRIKDGACG